MTWPDVTKCAGPRCRAAPPPGAIHVACGQVNGIPWTATLEGEALRECGSRLSITFGDDGSLGGGRIPLILPAETALAVAGIANAAVPEAVALVTVWDLEGVVPVLAPTGHDEREFQEVAGLPGASRAGLAFAPRTRFVVRLPGVEITMDPADAPPEGTFVQYAARPPRP